MGSLSKAVAGVVAASLGALGATFGCGGDTSTSTPPDGASPDAFEASDATPDVSPHDASSDGNAFVCATSPNSTPSEGCNCGIGAAPVTGPGVATCPTVDVPYACVSFDIPDPKAPRHECECRPKCGQQSSASSSAGGPGATMCACGEATFLPLGGESVTFDALASCSLTTCCKGEGACDCSSAPSFTCRPAQTKVAGCTTDDFNEDKSIAVLFPSGSYANVTKVTRCK